MDPDEDKKDLVKNDELDDPDVDDVRIYPEDIVLERGSTNATSGDVDSNANLHKDNGTSNGHHTTISVPSEHAENEAQSVIISGTGPIPVLYATPGSARITQQNARTLEDGQVTIVTPHNADNPDQEAPLAEKDLKPLTVFGVIALIMFLPTGLPGLIFAIKTRFEYYKGCESNDLSKAKKLYRLAERLIILSIILGILALVVILAIVEKDNTYSDAYAQHRLGLLHMGSG